MVGSTSGSTMRASAARRLVVSPALAGHATESRAGRRSHQQVQQPYPFVSASWQSDVAQLASEERVDDDGVHVALAAHCDGVPEPLRHVLEGRFELLLRLACILE
jgi:hypothetical protein